MPKTVLYFTDSENYGGAEQAMLELISSLDRQAWSPMLAYHPAPGLAELIERASSLHIPLYPVAPLPLGLEGARHIPAFQKLLAERQPSVFHANMTWPLSCKWALVTAILSRIPAIFATQHLYVEAPYSPFARLQQRCISWGVDRYFPVSNGVAEDLKRAFHFPPQKVGVIKNAFRQEFQEPYAGPIPAVPNLGQRPLILTLARLVPQKGLNDLLQAAVQVPQASFVVLGEGPDRADLEALARQLGIRDRFLFPGRVDNVPAWMSLCDVFVLPSLYEGLPLSLLEAMAAGRPVIATNIPGTREVVRHGETGFLVSPGCPSELAQAIQILLDDPRQARRMAQAAREMVLLDFSPRRVVQQVCAVYSEVLDSKGK